MGRKNLLSDTDYARGRDTRFRNSVLIGRVSSVEVDDKHANVRVIMPDKVDHNGTPLISKPIPVLQVASTAKRSFAVPRKNTPVALIKMPNGTSDYLVVGSFYTEADPPPVSDPMLDYVEYDDGSTMQFDASNGELTWKLKGDMNFDNQGAALLKFQGNVEIDSDGNITLKPAGTCLIEAATVHLKGALIFEGNITHTGNMTTSGTHTDTLGHHTSAARESELLERLNALEARLSALETALGRASL